MRGAYICIVACAGIAALASESSAGALAGLWVADVGGQQLSLVLRADGSGTLNGEPGRWQSDGQRIVLADAEGTQLVGQVAGDTLRFEVEGTVISFTRAGGAGRATSMKAFEPKPIKGKAVSPKDSGARFTVPRGWKHGYRTNASGEPVYVLTPPRLGERASLFMTRMMLTGKLRNMTMPERLEAGARELLDGASARTVAGPEAFTVDGKPAGRLVLQSALPNGKTAEGYLGAVVTDDWAFIIVGVYERDLADQLRPAIDGVLASMRVKAPAQNERLRRQLIGCWQRYEANSSASGYGQSQDKLRLGPDGSYRKHGFTSINAGGGSMMSEHDESGTWMVFGDELMLSPERGEGSSRRVRRQGASLYLGSTKHLPCR